MSPTSVAGAIELGGGPSPRSVTPDLPDASYVRALYPFSSDESASLAFHAGDLIRVLTKLESGWWDGLLRGRRGWFPSNYVEEVELADSDADSGTPEEAGMRYGYDSVSEANSARSSMDETLFGDGLAPPTAPGDSDEDAAYWIPQVTSEGQVYYFNTKNGTASWEIPFTPLSSILKSMALSERKTPITTGMRPPREESVDGMVVEEREDSEDMYRAMYGSGILRANGWRDVHDNAILAEQGSEEEDEEEDGEVLLFATTPGSPSPSKEEVGHRAISADIDRLRGGESGGAGANASVESGNDLNYSHNGNGLNHSSNGSVPIPEPVDLQIVLSQVSQDLTDALDDLSCLAQEHKQAEYEFACTRIKMIVGVLLQSLGIPSNQQGSVPAGDPDTAPAAGSAPAVVFAAQYRHLVAAISRMCLSAHIASGDWVPDKAVAKMLEDATDLVTYTKSMIAELASTNGISSKHLQPVAIHETVASQKPADAPAGSRQAQGDASIMLTPEALADLASLSSAVRHVIKLVHGALQQFEKASSDETLAALVTVLDGLLLTLKGLLHYLRQFDFANLDNEPLIMTERLPAISEFAKSKQLLYNTSSQLLLICQNLLNVPAIQHWSTGHQDAVDATVKALDDIETAIQSTNLNGHILSKEFTTRADSHLSKHVEVDNSRRVDSPSLSVVELTINSQEPPALVTRSPLLFSKPRLGSSPQLGQTPWFLDHEHESDISYDHKGNVKSGTLQALVERLTRHDHLDSVYNNTFLLTYRSFTTAEQLTSLLMQRFTIEPPPGLTSSQLGVWSERKQNPIRLRVFNIFKSWLENFFMEPPTPSTRSWLTTLSTFAETTMTEHIGGAPVLVKLVEMRLRQDDIPFRKMTLNNTGSAPNPIIPRNLKKVRLLDIDPLEVARQLTIMESTIYNRIKPTECLDKSWSRADAVDSAENIKAMILRSNQITAWVAEAILYQTDLKKRVNLIKHFVYIAEKCRTLNNFSTLTAIISGLNSAPIHRLKRTWDLLSARVATIAEDLNLLMNSSKNFSTYRETLHQMQPPCVPFLGVYLTDLTFIEDGNPDMAVKARHLINISKRQKTADVIRDVQQFQAVPYNLTIVPEIQSYIGSCMDITRDISDLYELSLEREPREREDEKIARLLQESGFL